MYLIRVSNPFYVSPIGRWGHYSIQYGQETIDPAKAQRWAAAPPLPELDRVGFRSGEKNMIYFVHKKYVLPKIIAFLLKKNGRLETCSKDHYDPFNKLQSSPPIQCFSD